MSGHVDRWLQRYLDGAVPSREAAWISEHLLACERCRMLHDDVARGRVALDALPSPGAPPDWELVERALAAAPAVARVQRRRRVLRALGVAAGLLLVVLGGTLVAVRVRPTWVAEASSGSPRAGGRVITDRETLGFGESIVTDALSTIRLVMPGLGTVDVAPNSRLRVVEGAGGLVRERRLALDRGSLHARVLAPPRLFVVDTPAATAIDLGCEYELFVADDGTSRLVVRSGRVALAQGSREVIVRAGEELVVSGSLAGAPGGGAPPP